MSSIAAVLLVFFIAVFLWMIWHQKQKWKTVYERYGDQSQEVEKRYNYLKRQGVHCRLKNNMPTNVKMIGSQATQMPKQATARLQVKRKEIDSAYKHLSDFNRLTKV